MRFSLLYLPLAAITFFLSSSADACTGIKLTAKDGSAVHGRTCEFGIPLDISTAVIPRGYSFTGTTPEGKGLSYQTKYAAVGTICFDNPAIMDGMNEKGLSVGIFYFPGFASYAKITKDNQEKALSPIEFSNWILTQFATLDEVKQALNNIFIAPTVIQGWGETPPPFHYVVYDKSGNSLVIEPLEGKLKVYDNPLGVFTNSPTFDWHMTNLRNYINLKTFNATPLKIEGQVFAPLSQGSGLVGMPGDFSSTSRFVRAAIYSSTASPSSNSQEGVFQAFHILNQFDIPVGAVREESKGKIFTDTTIATAVHDPVNLRYYFKTYDDQTIRYADLKALDLNSKEIKSAKSVGKQIDTDISHDLKPLAKS